MNLRTQASCQPDSSLDVFFPRYEVEVITDELPERTTPGLGGLSTSDMNCIWNYHASILIDVFNSSLMWRHLYLYGVTVR